MPHTSAYISRLLDPYQLPHDDVRFDGRVFQRKRDVLKGITTLASAGYYLANNMAKKHRLNDLAEDLEAEMDTDGTPHTPAGRPVNETQSLSAFGTMSKSNRREALIPSSLDRKQPPMTLAKFGKQIRPKSVWSSLRDLVSGKKVLRNNFSFKLESSQDRRGLIAIPLRHDATLGFPTPGDSTYNGWQVGTQAKIDVAGSGGFQPYSTMLLPNNGKTWSPGTQPANDQAGVVIPRLSLPCLEQTSWDLNQLKLVPKNLQEISTTALASGADHSIVQPVVQLQSSGVPIDANGQPEWMQGIPDAGNSMARKQDQGQMNMFPGKNTVTSFPQFKTQLGGGTLKMRVCNQGTNRMTVEFVVLKVVNPYVGTSNNIPPVDPACPAPPGIHSLLGGNCTRIWSQLWRMVGYEHARKVTKNVNFGMGNEPKSVPELMDEPICSPYFPWLPSSLFKAKYPQFWNSDGTMPAGNQNLAPTATTATTVTNSAVGGNSVLYQANPANPLNLTNVPIGDGTVNDQMAGQLGQDSPYRSVGRGHATIAGAAERTITIPIPGSNYNASRIQGMATNVGPGLLLDDAMTALMNDESYIVLMSINGSLQDIIEPNALDDSIKVIGKAYTQAKADVYCEYKETVYPSCCDYADITPMAYNLGSVRGSMVKPSTDAFPGKVLPMAHATPTVGTGVLRTGASERGAPNEGS